MNKPLNKPTEQSPKKAPRASETQRRMNGGVMPLGESAKWALELQRRNAARRR